LDAGFLRSPQPAAVEAGRRLRGETNLVRRASPAIFAFPMPKASALKFHQSNGSRLDNALLALRKDSRVLRHRRASADCFGANPVASALGTTPGATLTRLCEHTMRVSSRPSKPELPTWLGTGTSYLAATADFAHPTASVGAAFFVLSIPGNSHRHRRQHALGVPRPSVRPAKSSAYRAIWEPATVFRAASSPVLEW
jgi:hypothetical protein